jgi:multidrug efflux pump subunit AcrA (membrane-fusion protein)
MKKLFSRVKNAIKTSLRKRPLITFVSGLALLLGLIVLANFIRNPEPGAGPSAPEAKVVETYNIGTAPVAQIQGRVEKTGVITIVAQSGGVVRHIAAKPGETVGKGANLISLATNYQGANSASVQRQITQKSYQLSKDTLDQQKELIQKQKDVANTEDARDEELRKIDEDAVDEINELLDINEDILNSINDNLDDLVELQTASPSAETESLIENLRGTKANQLSAVFGLRQQLRSEEYTVDENEEPTKLRELNKEIALKRLELQEKSLQLEHEVAYLNYKVALITESLMYPSAPFAGTVERVHVRVGEVVSPGDPLITFTGNKQRLSVVAFVPENIARNISPLDASTILINNDEYSTVPLHISTEATDGLLFSVIYDVPDEYAAQISDNSIVTIKIPIGFADTNGVVPSVPIDIIHQLQDTSFVYIVQDGKAVSREVKIGEIYGSQVQILEGLESGETVIMNRNVIEGDLVTTS